MKTAAQIFSEVQMILARREAGELSDGEVVALITELMDTPDAMSISLDMVPTPGRQMDGDGGDNRA